MSGERSLSEEYHRKPDFFGPEAASAFQDLSVAQAYRYRPPYPSAAIDILLDLVVDQPQVVLDVGCGTGYLARHLSDYVDRVDALDISEVMIEQGKLMPDGDSPTLRWMVGSAESANLEPPYALITAGDSVHWLEWSIALPRFASLLTSHGVLAILGVEQLPTPWEEQLWRTRHQYSVIPHFQSFDVVRALEDWGLFKRLGLRRTEPVRFSQSLDDYIESFHGRAAFSRERMSATDAAAFDEDIRILVTPYSSHSAVHPDYQRQKIGGALLRAAQQQAAQRGITCFEAWTRDDAGTLRWYESHGFTWVKSYLHVYLQEQAEVEQAITSTLSKLHPVSVFAHYTGPDTDAVRARFERVHDCNCFRLCF